MPLSQSTLLSSHLQDVGRSSLRSTNRIGENRPTNLDIPITKTIDPFGASELENLSAESGLRVVHYPLRYDENSTTRGVPQAAYFNNAKLALLYDFRLWLMQVITIASVVILIITQFIKDPNCRFARWTLISPDVYSYGVDITAALCFFQMLVGITGTLRELIAYVPVDVVEKKL